MVATSRCEVRSRGARHECGRHHDRRVGAVRGTEGLVDVVVEALDQRRAEGRVVGLLARVEAQVLEELHPGQSSARRRRTGSTLYFSTTWPLRPAEVRARHDDGAARQQFLEERERRRGCESRR